VICRYVVPARGMHTCWARADLLHMCACRMTAGSGDVPTCVWQCCDLFCAQLDTSVAHHSCSCCVSLFVLCGTCLLHCRTAEENDKGYTVLLGPGRRAWALRCWLQEVANQSPEADAS
jgi:hypothetical protein